MKLTGIRQKVFLDRYSVKNKKGEPVEKTPQAMWRRIAKAVAVVEEKSKRSRYENDFYEALSDFKYVPGGRIMSGAGTGYAVTFYNCFVLPSPPDSREGIMENLSQMVEIMARGGGVGINLSSLRPRGARVRKVNGFSSGPMNWAELYSVATKDIIQQGGTRRGALMLMLWDWHPDLEEFITVKKDLRRINGANLSVCVSDRFMRAVKNDEDWQLIFPDTRDAEYDSKWNGDIEEWLKLGKKVKVFKTVRARKIWDLIAEAAWASAEPGVVFMERYNKLNNNWYWNRINCVNPCGEEGLPAWGVCNLGSVNLSALVENSGNINKKGKFDFKTLKKVVRAAVRFQDNVVDLDPYVFEGIRKTQLEGERRIGLGTLGLGDALIKMHLRYGSPASLRVIRKIYKTICDEAYRTSVKISREKGAFPKFDAEKYPEGQFIKTLPGSLRKEIKKYGVRNSIILMQAPTGTGSLLAGTTSGIEPVYEFEFKRHDRLGEHIMRHPLYEEWLSKNKIKDEKTVVKPDYFVAANDLSPEDHVRVQAEVQKYVDASISKTVNAPKTHSVEDVKRLYTLAYDLGCKGIAYMRDGSRQGVLERTDSQEKPAETAPATNGHAGNGFDKLPEIKPRPMVVSGSTYQINTPVGKAYITINTNGHNEPLELFVNVGKAGSDLTAMAESLGRMISLSLRVASHLSPTERVRQVIAELADIGGSRTIGFGKDRVRSLPDAVAKVLSQHFSLKNGNGFVHKNEEPVVADVETIASHAQIKLEIPKIQTETMADLCPECGQTSLAFEEGCKKCYSCGYSEC